MGIRMRHRRTAPARASTGGAAGVPLPPVPAVSLSASTARIPVTLASARRRARAGLRHALHRRTSAADAAPRASARRPWADLARGCLAPALALLPRPGPARPATVRVVGADPVSARPAGPSPRRSRRRRRRRGTGRGATP
ncbi:hypothetical protein GCM10023220_56920 [Streptomyces ziwulingensis]|uniref:Uncharacterized protein n=1 Tax=Streptomyces ziwulingensis TaxID=1045501 RepID=A0ABP9CUM2_9ACTN